MKLNQVTVPCLDYEASVKFYATLGLRQIVASPPRYARFETPTGETFSIHRVDDTGPCSRAVIYFEVADVDRVVEDLRAKGLKFDSEPADESWLWREARLTDPAGNPLCIYHAGENRRYPPWRMD
jgi:hydroxymethylpyrimidine/phosphomethylpyrimidine kinase